MLTAFRRVVANIPWQQSGGESQGKKGSKIPTSTVINLIHTAVFVKMQTIELVQFLLQHFLYFPINERWPRDSGDWETTYVSKCLVCFFAMIHQFLISFWPVEPMCAEKQTRNKYLLFPAELHCQVSYEFLCVKNMEPIAKQYSFYFHG